MTAALTLVAVGATTTATIWACLWGLVHSLAVIAEGDHPCRKSKRRDGREQLELVVSPEAVLDDGPPQKEVLF